MSPATNTKFAINRQIRSVFVRHFIDLGFLTITTAGTTVRIRGVLKRLSGSQSVLTPAIVEEMFRQISKVQGVRSVLTEFENWRQVGGANVWVQLDDKGRVMDADPIG